MGQKVNPVGLRLGINRGWDSVWYAKKQDFGNYLIEDFKIRELNKKNVEIKNKFKEIAKSVNKKSFTFYKESKENGDLYGSIKPKEISNMIKEQTNSEVSPSQIILKEELNKIGTFKVDLNFHSEVQANISIKIDKIQSK